MGAAGLGVEAEPAEFAAGMIQRFEFRHGAGRVGVLGVGDAASGAAQALGAGEGKLDPPLHRDRQTMHDSPIGLLDAPPAEGGGELGGRAGCARQQQSARGVAIEAMDKPWPVGRAKAKAVEQPVEMMG